MRLGCCVVLAVLTGWAGTLGAQEFLPPPVEEEGGFRIGLLGFGARGGVGFGEGETQALVGIAVDLGNLGTKRFRPRASFEVGLPGEVATYLTSLEALFRFTNDTEAAVPYAGVGLGVFAQQDCADATDPSCPRLWITVVVGFELRFRPAFNWLFEYHGTDAFRSHRLLIGLTTRRGT